MKEREKLFAALEESDLHELHLVTTKTEGIVLEKAIKGIPQEDHDHLATLLYTIIRQVAQEAQDHTADILPVSTMDTLKDVATIITAFIKKEDNLVPLEMFEAARLLHAFIFLLGFSPEEKVALSAICGMCELWYVQEREGFEALIVHTITSLLLQSLEPNSKAADLKRLYDMRTALNLLDLDDLSSADVCQLLIRTPLHPLFLSNPKGKKFIIHLFTINLGLIDKLHESIQYSLASSKLWMVDAYADIYFKAWRLSEGPFRIRIEHNCIQDFIKHSIHLKNPHLLKCCRQILEHFHLQKLNLKHVDSMLVRLYEPILWRSLQVANPYVRRNAVVQLAVSFPLISDEWVANEVEEALQKQFELIQQLQVDPVPLVRAQAVRLTGHILSTFFDFVPQRVSQVYMSTLVHNLSKDSSSADVRSAVVLAVEDMVKNPLTHSLLRQMLPDLKHMLHDNSERVRINFIKLLLTVRCSKGLKFSDVVDLDNLLARLETDKGSKIQRQITELLVDSYFPYAKKSTQQLIQRCVHMVQVNPMAAKKFYAIVPKLVPAGPIVKFMTKLWRTCLYQWIIERKAAQEMGDEYQEEVEREAKRGRKSYHLAVDDITSGATLFTVVALCWDGISSEIEEKENEPLKSYLLQQFDETTFLMMYNDLICVLQEEYHEQKKSIPLDALAELEHSVLRMAANLPASSLPEFAVHILPSLRPDTPLPVLVALLCALFSWNFQEKLLEMISAWIQSVLRPTSPDNEEKIEGSEEEELHIEECKFGFSLLDLIFTNDELRAHVLSSTECVSTIINTLHCFIPKIEKRLQSVHEEGGIQIPDQLLLASVDLYYRFLLHVVVLSPGEYFQELLEWGMEKVVPNLLIPEDEEEGTSKRKRDFDERLSDHNFSERLMHIIVALCSEFIIAANGTHFARVYLTRMMELLSDCILSEGFSESLLRSSTKVVYHLHHGQLAHLEDKENSGEIQKILDTCFKFFKCLIEKVSPHTASKSIRVTDFVTLATQRPTIRPVIELIFQKIVEGFHEPTINDTDFISHISEISNSDFEAYLQWLIPTSIKSNVMMHALSSYLMSKVLTSTPSLQAKWKTMQIISLLLNEGMQAQGRRKKNTKFAPIQNLLINIITTSHDDLEVKEKAEELLQLSYGS